ncbi:hypothetical protein PC39_10077 [Salinisphaera sp. PC39]
MAVGLTAGIAGAQTTLQVPALMTWSDVNALTVNPDAEDGRTYLYPDAVTRDADTDQDGTGSRAFISWTLDSGLGESPGIQVVTNDLNFPRRNCLMASGTDATSGERKTCSDPQGSSKRFRLAITEPDQPVDLVFNTGNADLVYADPIDPTAEDFEVGRIYRVIQKYINDTGKRLTGFRIEVGFGTGDSFVPADFATDDVAFELRTNVPRAFFGEYREDDNGRKVWTPGEYATFSPAMFDVLEGRYPGETGFFDDDIAGLVPPQDVEAGDKTQYIDSGDDVDGATGIVGPTTVNYFDMSANQAAGAGLAGSPLGYMLPVQLLPTGIYEDDDGDPATEGELVAWWDGSDWRYGHEQDFAVVSDDQLKAWAKRPLSEDEVLEPPRYEIGLIDDMAGLNVDTFIYIGEDFDVEAHDTLTLRFTAHSVESDTIAGSETPAWMAAGSEPPALDDYRPSDSGGSDDDDFLGCSYNPRAPFDPTVLVLLAAALLGMGLRRRA